MTMSGPPAACMSYGIARGMTQDDRSMQNEFAARRPG
jgi:hypothetical protein